MMIVCDSRLSNVMRESVSIKAALLWALWVTAGATNGGGEHGLRQTYIAAYFESQTACQQVQALIHPQARWTKCIEAPYVQPLSRQ